MEIDIRPVKNKRTLDQNRLMWALLNRLALALSGGTPGGVTAEQCYLDLLAEFGAEVEIWRVPVKALPALRNTYRVVQMVELLDDGYCMARLGLGSGSLTGSRCDDFIERIFDRLSEAGVDDAETTEQYRELEACRWIALSATAARCASSTPAPRGPGGYTAAVSA